MTIRFIRPDDFIRCNAFHNLAYGTQRTLRQWEWQFNQHAGSPNPFVVVEEGGQIVGTQALIPITMVDAHGAIRTAKSEETLVAPSMRGRGVFQRMYDLLFGYAADKGIQAIWGFTPACKPFEKVGFEVTGRTSQLFLPFSSRSVVAVDARLGSTGLGRHLRRGATNAASVVSAAMFALGARQPEWLRLAIGDEPPTGAAALCHTFVREWGGATILRDEAYLKWRYCDNPYVRTTLVCAYRGDELVGWLAYALADDAMGYIVDTIVTRGDDERVSAQVLSALLHHAVVQLRSAGAVAVRGWSVNRHPFDGLLTRVARRMGFFLVRRGEPVVVHPTGEDGRADGLKRWDSWYVTRAFTQGTSG